MTPNLAALRKEATTVLQNHAFPHVMCVMSEEMLALLDRLEAAERVCQAADTVISQGYAVEPPIYTAVIAWRSVHKAKP